MKGRPNRQALLAKSRCGDRPLTQPADRGSREGFPKPVPELARNKVRAGLGKGLNLDAARGQVPRPNTGGWLALLRTGARRPVRPGPPSLP